MFVILILTTRLTQIFNHFDMKRNIYFSFQLTIQFPPNLRTLWKFCLSAKWRYGSLFWPRPWFKSIKLLKAHKWLLITTCSKWTGKLYLLEEISSSNHPLNSRINEILILVQQNFNTYPINEILIFNTWIYSEIRHKQLNIKTSKGSIEGNLTIGILFYFQTFTLERFRKNGRNFIKFKIGNHQITYVIKKMQRRHLAVHRV